MKRIVLTALLFISILCRVSAQEYYNPGIPQILMNTDQGFITINELTTGIGLGDTKPPYSKAFIGLTSTMCYQINKDFIGGMGTGISFYNKGILVPLFLHFRYRVYESRYVPFLFGDAGFMMDFSGKKDTRAFINPGIGCSFNLHEYLAVTVGTGIFVQWGNMRDSFVSLKTGVVYKFN
jgi:hypothetical protein